MNKISPAHHKLCYKLGRKVYLGHVPKEEAELQLVRAGMNPSSATISINNLVQMLQGKRYKRAMSIPQTKHYLTAIQQDDGKEGLERALTAFTLHLPYLRKAAHNGMPGLTRLLSTFQAFLQTPTSSEDAINDFPTKPEGSNTPDRGTRTTAFIKRSPTVRAYVIRRAEGKCEHCGEFGFLLSDGAHYLESHHIISLGTQGPDKPENVIALCANHHREAHFGADAERLEHAFKLKVALLESR